MGSSAIRPVHVAVGNLNLDISISLDSYPMEDSHVFARDSWIGIGGAATNYSVATARLGHTPYLVARAGGDALKLGLLDRLASDGVRVDYIDVAPRESMGTVVVLLVPPNGTRTMITIRGANEHLTPSHVPRIGNAQVYHLASVKPSLVAALCSENWWARRDFIATYDPGGETYRYPRWMAEVLSCVDVLMVNERELMAVMRAARARNERQLLDYGLKILVVKRGEGGAMAHTPDSTLVAYPTRSSKLVDVTGAGDAFDAAFNVWLVEGRSLKVAVRAAVAAGALKVSRKGSANMPRRAEVEEAMEFVDVEEA